MTSQWADVVTSRWYMDVMLLWPANCYDVILNDVTVGRVHDILLDSCLTLSLAGLTSQCTGLTSRGGAVTLWSAGIGTSAGEGFGDVRVGKCEVIHSCYVMVYRCDVGVYMCDGDVRI